MPAPIHYAHRIVEDLSARCHAGIERRAIAELHDRIGAACGGVLVPALVARFHGAGFQEIADAADISVATAFSRVQRAVGAVREIAAELDVDASAVGSALGRFAA